MRTRFYIEKRKDEQGSLLSEDRPVFLSVSFEGKRIILGTGIKVDIYAWDPELQRVGPTNPGAKGLNSWLSTLEEIAERTMRSLQHSGNELNVKNFRTLFLQLKPQFSQGFFKVFFQFMEDGMPRWSLATYRKVRTIYKLLREFDDQTAYGISFGSMDELFLQKFMAYCRQIPYKDSTTYKAVSIVVWFLNWATGQGFNVYMDYKQFYKIMDPPTNTSRNMISLKWDELMGLQNCQPETRMMERARDLFCFMCFTGLRFSEIQLLKKEDLTANEVIVRGKGNRLRRVPLNKYGRKIYLSYMNKYFRKHTAFPSISLITMNKYLRELGKRAGLNRAVSLYHDENRRVALFTCLTAGIAVNTFIVNAIELEIPAEYIAEFTGVSKDSRVRKIKMDLAGKEIQKFDQR